MSKPKLYGKSRRRCAPDKAKRIRTKARMRLEGQLRRALLAAQKRGELQSFSAADAIARQPVPMP